ncbi:hypothetical protein M408DRAFT_332393, partial [Serendipita vermifera MAFF 305830]
VTIPGSTPSSTAASQSSSTGTSTGSSQTGSSSSPAQSNTPQTTSNTQETSSNTGAIAGGVVGGVAVLALVILSIWLYRRKKPKSTPGVASASNAPPMAHHMRFPNPMNGGVSPSSNTATHFLNPTIVPTPSFVTPTVVTTASFVNPTVGTTPSFTGPTVVTPPLVPDPRAGGTPPSLHATSPYFSHPSRASTYSIPSQPLAEVMDEPAQTEPLLASTYQSSPRAQTPPWVQGVDLRPGPGVPLAPDQGNTGDSELPEYRDDYTAHAAPGIVGPSSSGAVDEAAQAHAYEESISQFCTNNRDLISPVLESKLRAARYLPKDNPSEIPAEYWRDSYGVEFFDLKRLQEAYERNKLTEAILRKEATTARVKGKAGPSWKPS